MNLTQPVQAVIVDLDGTMLDTVPDLTEAAAAMLTELGRQPLGAEAVRDLVGKGLPNLVARCLAATGGADAALQASALEVFKRHYLACNGRHTTVYSNVMAGLEAFARMAMPLACMTNKAAAFAEPLLEMTGLRGYFAVVVSGDTLPEKKPHPAPLLYICRKLGVAPHEAVVVGDSINDVQAARAAGCRVLCVPYGYNEGRDVRELDCDAIVADLAEAARLIESNNRYE